jgi:hypothetical protein
MNIETRIDKRLWDAIRSSYENRNFTGSIQDSIYFLSDLIREKSGLEGDGATLVGQAFGGSSPLLKVNRLKTENDKNVQKGIVNERGQPLNRDKIEPVSNHYAKTNEIRICRSVLPYNRQMK